MEPFEIIAAPFTVWTAPVGTAFPAIDEQPAAAWVLVGTSGDRNVAEGGVTVTHEQTIEVIRTEGSTGPVKAFRTEEGLLIAFSILDVSLEQYATALNSPTVAETAPGTGTAGTKSITLRQGPTVATRALLVRGPSPYGEQWNMQYEVPVCFQSGNPAPVYTKTAAAALALQFTALEDPNAASDAERFGRLLAQNAAAL